MKPKIYHDQRFMEEALIEAKKGLNTAHPNPRVGCVFVKEGSIIARGYHRQTGQAHAEVDAIAHRQASLEGSTCYVTLEPCSHDGRTPPCVNALIQHKIQRCVIATQDPNPLVNGRGIALLEQAGIEVTCGVLEEKALTLNKGFFKRMRTHMPQVIAKIAASLDGKTAMANGQSQWITSEASRQDAHQLRAQVGAILTTYKTVNADNPRLTARLEQGQVLLPLRVILDTHLQVNPMAQVFNQPGQTVVVTSNRHTALQLESFKQSIQGGCEVVTVNALEDGLDLKQVLLWLGERQINQVLIEAGQGLLGRMLAQKWVDDLILYLAPKLMGSQTMGMFELPLMTLEQHLPLTIQTIESIGQDIKISATL